MSKTKAKARPKENHVNTPLTIPPVDTAHRDYWERHNCALVYDYDPTEDGPEVEAGKAIRSVHTSKELRRERKEAMTLRISRAYYTLERNARVSMFAGMLQIDMLEVEERLAIKEFM